MTSSLLETPASSDLAPTHVALNSFELSALLLLDFDPDAALAIRQGARINTIDDDDSGAIRHLVPLCGFPEPIWRVVASAIPSLPNGPGTQPLKHIYATRIMPPGATEPQFYRLDPFELAAGLRADHPDAFDQNNAIAARIHALECLRGVGDLCYPIEPDELTDTGWLAAIRASLCKHDDVVWSPALLRLRRAIAGKKAVEERAWSVIAELQTAICVIHEAPFGAGLDFATYLSSLISRLRDDPAAMAQLAADARPDLDMVRHALASGDGPAFLASL
ncbi:hypothetical protein AWL63_18135 [Sphingomonas panacis]|uniref:Uncharacterized protein n=1 Tax=Sphingomonas panacis TaxID=1560345 RepID=A0A1B3ZDR5_9SPHN|nr:hypothetical protein [Sphingomonas panacis]AOH85566.1 hypothetical protein AWL63_18135 [Sphingomonas panacis]